MAAILTWYKDNSHTITATVVGSGSAAVVTGTLLDSLAATVWTGSLAASGAADTYTATVDPADATVSTGHKYMLRIAATHASRFLEFEEPVQVQDRRAG